MSSEESWEQPPIPKFDEIIETPDDSKGPLTFGVELEFLVPIIENNSWSDPHPQDGRDAFRHDCEADVHWLDLDHEWLNENFHDSIRRALEKTCDICFRLSIEDIFHEPHDNVPFYDVCRLTEDATVKFEARHFTDHKAYEWRGMEVTTDVMRCDDATFYRQRIKDVCRSIRSVRVHLNETCGVHVHVGHGDESFSLVTMKKFSTLIFLVDELLLDLHHPSRRHNEHCKLLKYSSFVHKLTLEELMADGRVYLSSAQREEKNKFVPARFALKAPQQTLQVSSHKI